MDFATTDDQQALVSTVREVLAVECPRSLVRGVVEGTATPEAPWAQAVELGWPGLTVPAELGGLGLSVVELAMVCRELGRAVAPGPFLATMTQFVPAILYGGDAVQRKRWLPLVARGEVTGTLAHAEDGAWPHRPDDLATTAVPSDGGFRLDGVKTHVLDGDTATELVVTAAGPSGATVVAVVPRDRVQVDRVRSLDATRPLGTVRLQAVPVEAERVLAAPDPAGVVEQVLQVATIGLAAELVGTCEAILDMTVDHARTREQFGRPIGSFQAVKHQLADLHVTVARAIAVVEFAAMTAAEDDARRPLAASMAKAAAGDAQRQVAGAAIQLHGGIGYTWEHDLQLLVKRATASDPLLGTAAVHRHNVATLLALP